MTEIKSLETIRNELAKLENCVIKGIYYGTDSVFDAFCLQLEKDGKPLRFDMAFRNLIDLFVTVVKET